DAYPSMSKPDDFPYNHCGAAVLLEYDQGSSRGFWSIEQRTRNTGRDEASGRVNLYEDKEKSRYRIYVRYEEDYVRLLLEHAIDTAKDYLDRHSPSAEGLVLLCSQLAPDFGSELALGIGVAEDHTIDVYADYGDPHSSALGIAYHLGTKNGLLPSADSVLFVNAGTGLSVGCGLYSPNLVQPR
ncbi:MAG: hypothetical protein HN348_26150, partial [Proteobacteria bacterium]|nr:hypothetical protein [Pseudomonadota bacterium]